MERPWLALVKYLSTLTLEGREDERPREQGWRNHYPM